MSFERLLRPRTIAIFGGAQAQEVIRQSDLMGYTGEIWPVHPKKEELLGRKVYRSVNDLPGSPDAAYVGVNRYLTIDIVRELAQRGAGGAVCYATGFIEAGEEGTELQDRHDAAGRVGKGRRWGQCQPGERPWRSRRRRLARRRRFRLLQSLLRVV